MRIAVFGTGGVGGYFGGRLAQAGEEVVFIARGAHLQAMRDHGLRLESIAGDCTIAPVQATDTPAEAGVVDVVLIGVKAWQIPETARALQPLLGPDTCIVPLQNGLEAAAQLADVLGSDRVHRRHLRDLQFYRRTRLHQARRPRTGYHHWGTRYTAESPHRRPAANPRTRRNQSRCCSGH